jgi:NAD(P)-dependent dehydrogenase (short-subunit alcohol dehydrogenase family)
MQTNKIAIVTGGSRGLGKNTTLKLSENGIDIILTYKNNKSAADETVAEIGKKGQKAVALQLDVSDVGSLDGFIQKVKIALLENWGAGHFDFLINNAGVGAHAFIANTTEETFDHLVNLHFKGVYFLTQKLLPLIADKGGIVNISTGLTRFSFPGYAAYAAVKGAIEVFTKYLAKELGQRGIRANVVAPGAIDNDFNKKAFEANPKKLSLHKRL